MKTEYVLDTMALVLWLENRKVNPKLKKIFSSIEAKNVKVCISSMTLAEIGYLSERNRIELTLERVKELNRDSSNVEIYPVTDEVIYEAFKIKDIPELHDRIIAATANLLKIKLISNDSAIKNSNFVETIW